MWGVGSKIFFNSFCTTTGKDFNASDCMKTLKMLLLITVYSAYFIEEVLNGHYNQYFFSLFDFNSTLWHKGDRLQHDFQILWVFPATVQLQPTLFIGTLWYVSNFFTVRGASSTVINLLHVPLWSLEPMPITKEWVSNFVIRFPACSCLQLWIWAYSSLHDKTAGSKTRVRLGDLVPSKAPGLLSHTFYALSPCPSVQRGGVKSECMDTSEFIWMHPSSVTWSIETKIQQKFHRFLASHNSGIGSAGWLVSSGLSIIEACRQVFSYGKDPLIIYGCCKPLSWTFYVEELTGSCSWTLFI